MQIFKDFDRLYNKCKPLAIAYYIGYAIGGSITLVAFIFHLVNIMSRG